MTTQSTKPSDPLHKYACSICARRKVKCDKGSPCSNCVKAQAKCVYEVPAPHRPRRRAADEELLVRLAQYEELMRKHNVDFSQYANSWVPSRLEFKMSPAVSQSPAAMISLDNQPSLNNPAVGDVANAVGAERHLWFNLRSELKYPYMKSLARQDDKSSHSKLSLQSLFENKQPELHELFPEPRALLRLWQIFVENVNPLTKIIHVPTLQQRVSDASWGGPLSISKSLTALLFAIFTVAIESTPSEECQASFGESKHRLITQYRTATLRALIVAEFLTTRDLETMQALVLHLLADPGSDLTSTLAGAALRLCEKMGMGRDDVSSKTSFFEKEMRIRLWWQLRALDYRCRVSCLGVTEKSPLLGFGLVRLPLNVNDADLHPNMTEPPSERIGPTEMICVLMKLEVFDHLRSSPMAASVYDNIVRGAIRDKKTMELEITAVNELETMFEEKFFRNLDKAIPLHALTRTIANFSIARMRFRVLHPRRRADPNSDEISMTPEERDILFESALIALELMHSGTATQFTSHLFTHMTLGFQIDAYIYILSDLRWRCSGGRVTSAWKRVELLYNDYPEITDDTSNAFYFAFGDLTLKAWDARRKELILNHGSREFDITPQFIHSLLEKRGNMNATPVPMTAVPESYSLAGLMTTDEHALDSEFWGDFLTL